MSIDYEARQGDLDFLSGKEARETDVNPDRVKGGVGDGSASFMAIMIAAYLLQIIRNGLIIVVAATLIFSLYIDSHNHDTKSPYSKILSCSYYQDAGTRNCSLFNRDDSNVHVYTEHNLFVDAKLMAELKQRSVGNEYRIFANSEEYLLLSYIGADAYSISVPSNIRLLEESILLIAEDGELSLSATKSLTSEDSEHINNLIKRSLVIMDDRQRLLDSDYGKYSSEKLILSYAVDFIAKYNALATVIFGKFL